MKSVIRRAFLPLLLASTLAPVAAQAGQQALATGSGHITVNGELRTFAFAAHRDSGGVTLGELQLNNRALDSKTHGTLNCLVVNGNRATMSGVVDTSTNFPAGTPIWVEVVDNGEGGAAAADQITLVALFPGGAGVPCTVPSILPAQDIERGNIQVH